MSILGQVLMALMLTLVVDSPLGLIFHQGEPAQAHKVAWLNAWGDWHTRPGGDMPYALDSRDRMRLVVDHLRRTHADVGVLAEVERPQIDAFRQAAGKEMSLVTGNNTVDNVVFYRPTAFKLVQTRHFRTYYRDGQVIDTPIAVLADRRNGQEVAVIPVHSPATLLGEPSQVAWRQKNVQLIAQQVKRLHVPVVVAGDFNEHTPILCAMTTPAVGLTSPIAHHAGCERASYTEAPVDQIFLSPSLPRSGYRVYRNATVRRATDHGRYCELTIKL